MMAAVLEDRERLIIRDMEMPTATPGSLLLRVLACGICGSDLRIYHHGHQHITFPQILGHEIAGEVVAPGSPVEGFHPGERVVVAPPKVPCGSCPYCQRGQINLCPHGRSLGYQLPGGFAQYLLVPPGGVAVGIVHRTTGTTRSSVELVLTEPAACCLRGQRQACVSPGDTVVVLGGGPIGALHCRIARINGAAQVVLSEPRESRRRRAATWGVDRVVDPRSEDLQSEVQDVSGGWGADVVIVACSSRSAQEQALTLVRRGGRINLFAGLPAGESSLLVDTNYLHYNEVAILATHGSTPADNVEALRLIQSGQLRVDDLVTHVEPLSLIRQAFLEAEEEDALKVVVQPWADGAGGVE